MWHAPTNYRPISLLLTVEKVFERVVFNIYIIIFWNIHCSIFTYAPVNRMLNVTASITLWLQLLVATRMNKAIETKSNFFNQIHFPPK